MMIFLLGLLGKAGVPAKAQRVVLLALGVVAALLLLWGAKALYDHRVIANHDLKTEASAAKADRKADQNAAVQARKDAARTAQEADQLKKVLTNDQDPHARRLAFHRCLRLQQAARRDGRQPPVC